MAGARSTSRDIERYAGLFASRTRGMKSSAMRDLMAVIAMRSRIADDFITRVREANSPA